MCRLAHENMRIITIFTSSGLAIDTTVANLVPLKDVATIRRKRFLRKLLGKVRHGRQKRHSSVANKRNVNDVIFDIFGQSNGVSASDLADKVGNPSLVDFVAVFEKALIADPKQTTTEAPQH